MNDKSIAAFDGNYVTYWKERVAEATDGSKVANEKIFDDYLHLLEISPRHKVLDLGCGYGRLYTSLARYTPHVIGIDISRAMLEEAVQFPYDCLIEAQAEATCLPGCFVDRIVIWGTFDVTDQEVVLQEANRILKIGGKLLITGKNCRYPIDDRPAFVAERNAKLKNFPNHFTDVMQLCRGLHMYGFQFEAGYGFKKRGDFGNNTSFALPGDGSGVYYEYLLVLSKIGTCSLDNPIAFARDFSITAEDLAIREGFAGEIRSFLNWHKELHDD